MSAETKTRIALIPKNAREAVAIELTTYKGHRLCQIRIVVPGGPGGETATGKVVSLKPTAIPELLDAVKALAAEVQRIGWN